MSVFNDRDARSKLSASNKGRCVLGEIALLVSVDREKQCWVDGRKPSLRLRVAINCGRPPFFNSAFVFKVDIVTAGLLANNDYFTDHACAPVRQTKICKGRSWLIGRDDDIKAPRIR